VSFDNTQRDMPNTAAIDFYRIAVVRHRDVEARNSPSLD
jgi:hypothetical protein